MADLVKLVNGCYSDDSAEKKNTPLIKALLKKGTFTNSDYEYALRRVGHFGHSPAVAETLLKDVKVCIRNEYKHYAMQVACKYGDNASVVSLIEAGANVHSGEGLLYASMYGHHAVVKTLLEAGASVHALYGRALRYASTGKVVKLLIKAGADVHCKRIRDNSFTFTNEDEALIVASGYGKLSAVKELLKAGANVHAKSVKEKRKVFINGEVKREPWDAIMFAAERHHAEVVEVLAQAGAHLEQALYLASDFGDLACVKVLLTAGAGIYAEKALDASKYCGGYDYPEIVKALQKAASEAERAAAYSLLDGVKELFDVKPDATEGGWVYCLSNPSYTQGMVKIGRTTKPTVEERGKELSGKTAVPTPFVIEAQVWVRDPPRMESALHCILESKRVNGGREFFMVSDISVIKGLFALI